MISAAMLAAGAELSEPRLSPDGTVVAFVHSEGGTSSIRLVEVGGGVVRRLTTMPAPRAGRATGGGAYDWTPDGSAVVYAATDGDLWHQPVVGGPPRRITTQPPGQATRAPAVSPDGRAVVYVIDDRHVAVAALDDAGPWPRRLTPADAEFSFDPSWSADGSFVVWHSWRVPNMAWQQSTWTLAPVDDPSTLVELPVDGFAVQQPRFAPAGTDLAFLSDRTGWMNLTVFGGERDGSEPLVRESFEHGQPAWSSGQRSFAWSPDASAIVFTRNEGGYSRLCVVALRGANAGVVREVAKGVHGGLHWRGGAVVAVRSGAKTPTQLVAYDAGASGEGSWSRAVLAVGPVAGFEAHLAEPELVTWTADDGATIHGRLYRPVAADRRRDGASPLIVWVHGGPTDQWPVSFNPRIVYWTSRGWSVLVPDHRGSSGWGRAYTAAMDGRWGDLDVTDVAAGARAAVAEGWGDAGSLVAMGGSAGGFTVLNLLAHHGGAFAAGVAVYPVTDLQALGETTHRFEAHYTHSLVGPWPAARDRYRERSPLAHAARIARPLLVLHGSADDVVPVAQARSLVEAMVAAGRSVELHVYEGEGHGWRRPDTVADELARVESFLRSVLVG